MDFGLSEDQIMLDETLRSFLADQVSIERIRSLREESCPNHRDIWKELAELGATGILVPEEHGGSELSLLDAAVVAWTLGHAVTPSPFLGSSILATVALRDLSHKAIPGGNPAELPSRFSVELRARVKNPRRFFEISRGDFC